jgi:hypothetical protein
MPDTELDDFVNRYLAAWNEPDRERRDALVAALWAPDGILVNGANEYRGRVAIQDAVTISHEAFVGEGYRFVPGDASAAHHTGVRLAWDMVREDATDSAGTNFLLLDADGLIAVDYQFLER